MYEEQNKITKFATLIILHGYNYSNLPNGKKNKKIYELIDGYWYDIENLKESEKDNQESFKKLSKNISHLSLNISYLIGFGFFYWSIL